MDNILRIDMGAKKGPKAGTVPLGKYAGLGGRALTSSVVADEVPPACHPLSAENKLVIAPGLLSGSVAAMSGRISVGCKSPLTGGIKEANAGGQPSQMLARLGYAAIILEGKPKDDSLYKIVINRSGVTIEADNSLRMTGNYEIVARMKEAFGDKIGVISIGQAGEQKLSGASIAFSDMELRPTRHAARGGVGAVMGAKGVKVIVVDDDGCGLREPANKSAFKEANKRFVAGLRQHPVTGQGLPAFGSNMLHNVINEAGALPTHNFARGRFEGCAKICGETLAAIENARGGEGAATHGCHRGCVIRCSGTFYAENGAYISKQPEYETVWAHGSNCGIADLDAIATMDRMDDDFGLDTIEMGAAIGVAMEAGLVDFGDARAAIELLAQVGKGAPLGKILGSGAQVTGQVLGVERVPVVKGQSLPAYDPRAVQGIGVTYATSTMGADHTAGYAVTRNILGIGAKVDPLGMEGQVDLSRGLQVTTAALDSTGMCLFVTFATMDQPETMQALCDVLSAFTGRLWAADEFDRLGRTILKKEREFNIRAGFTPQRDRLPEFFKKEPLAPHGVTFNVSDRDLDSVYNW